MIFYIHGYGAHCNFMGFFFKEFAESGYEVITMDQRGFGYSEGERGFIHDSETIYDD